MAIVLMPTILFGVEVGLAKPAKVSDPGFLFQDEVTKEIVIDVHRDHANAVNPFEDLSGKFKPDSSEYRALLLAAGLSGDAVLKADENVQVKSLKSLRLKFDKEFEKLAVEASVETVVESAAPESVGAVIPEAEESPALAPKVSASFSEVSEAGFADPRLGDYRLIPLERGLMMAGKSGDKRVFSNREVLKDDVFSVAIGESGKGERVLAILHQTRKQESQPDGKYTVWVLALTDSRIGWTKTLEFQSNSMDSLRSTASETVSGPASGPASEPAQTSQLTLNGETVSIAVGGRTKTLALKNGETADENKGPSSLTPASEN